MGKSKGKAPKGTTELTPPKKPRKRHSKLDVEIIEVLREKLREKEKRNQLLDRMVLTSDKELQRLGRRVRSAEQEAEVLMDALRHISDVPVYTEWAFRRARLGARKMLEVAKIRPPSSLGFSRKSSSRKKGKQKTS